MSKLIGILGVGSPRVGEFVHSRVAANTRAVRLTDHLQTVLFTNPAAPSAEDLVLGESGENPGQEMMRSLLLLHQIGAGVLAVPCAASHIAAVRNPVVAELAQAAPDAVLLDAVDLTVRYLLRHYPAASQVGLVGSTGALASGVFQERLAEHDMRALLPPESHQRRVQEALDHPEWGVRSQAGPVARDAVDAFSAAALRVIAEGAGAIVLVSTEVSMALTAPEIKGTPVVDMTTILARETIRQAAGEGRLISRQR
jgi:aspartate racemase